MRIIVIAAFFFPLALNGQMFFKPSQENVSNCEYVAMQDNSASLGVYWTVDSVAIIDLTSAFSIEFWQFLPEKRTSLEFFRIQCRDTTENYFRALLDENSYFQVEYVVGDSILIVDSENEVGDSPKSISGVIEQKDWYCFVYTFDGDTTHSLYVNGKDAEFSIQFGQLFDIVGPYDIINQTPFRSGPFRFYSKELSAANVATVWNNGYPSTQSFISNLLLEYLHYNNAWNGTNWSIEDTKSGVDGYSIGLDANGIVCVHDHNPDQFKEHNVSKNDVFLIDYYGGYSSYNYLQSGSKIGPFANLFESPYIWYDSATDKTFFGVLDHTGLGGNMDGIVLEYDHVTDRLKRGQRTNIQLPQGCVDTHPGCVSRVFGDTVLVVQENYHNSPLNYNVKSVDSLDFGFGDAITTGENNAYPNILELNGDAYIVLRRFSNDLYYLKTSDFSSWTTRQICDMSPSDAQYPYSISGVMDNLKVLNYRRSGGTGGIFTQMFFFQSDDGDIFYNVDSTYIWNTSISPIPDDTLEAHFMIKQAETGQTITPQVSACHNDTIVFIMRGYDGIETTYDSLSIFYSIGNSPMSEFKFWDVDDGTPRFLVYAGNGVWDMWVSSLDNLSLSRYRTFDFFQSFSLIQAISSPFEMNRYYYTSNHGEANEVVLCAVVPDVTGYLSALLLLYVYENN